MRRRVGPEVESYLGQVGTPRLFDGQDAAAFGVYPSGQVKAACEQRVIQPFLEVTVDSDDGLVAAFGVALVPLPEIPFEVGVELNRPFFFHGGESFSAAKRGRKRIGLGSCWGFGRGAWRAASYTVAAMGDRT